MTLKRQLLIASLLTLLIPWLGLQFVLELDQALRDQALQQLQGQAQRMSASANALMRDDMPADTAVPTAYAITLKHGLNIDGYGDDWPGYDEEFDDGNGLGSQPVGWQLAVDDSHLYLLLRVKRSEPQLFDPGRPQRPYDHIHLAWTQNGNQVERLIRTPAPGPVVGWQPDPRPRPDYRLQGTWQAFGDGYQVELQLPRPANGERFGFAVMAASGEQTVISGGPGLTPLPRLVTRSRPLERALNPFLSPGQRLVVLNPGGWVEAATLSPAAQDDTEFDALSPLQILERISLNGLRWLVRTYQPDPQTWPLEADRQPVDRLPVNGLVRLADGTELIATQALNDGRYLLLTQSLDQLLTLSGSALGTVISRSTLLVVALMLVLLGYSSWLSWRISRLQRAVSTAVDQDGRIVAALPTSTASDELGDLNRQFALLIDKLLGYTRYLESFSRRLSHELKTPVAIVRSSVDNLAHTEPSEDQRAYLERVSQAADRLSQILHGMSEAARLEQSFDHAEHEPFDLAEVAGQATAAYQALDPDHRIRYQGPAAGCPMQGSPELLVQLLDKLVDNARDFTPAQGLIEIRLSDQQPDHYELAVFNQGSQLPDHLASEIFSPFVSLRDGAGEGHLGQGLLIVQLIAEHHQGQARAHNEGNGVAFTIVLPRQPQAAH